MLNKTLKPLPIGISAFSSLRRKGAIYVDKTALIAQLVNEGEKVFLARPRRFGKSLLVSTLASLFQHGLRDFSGLAIEKIWKEKTYNVLRLDFSFIKEFRNVDDFESQFLTFIVSSIRDSGFAIENAGETDAVFVFQSWLASQPEDSLVILIDEYDAPLTAVLHDAEVFKHIRMRLSSLYSRLKGVSAPIHFLFMTGITKFTGTSIFSAFNDLRDISLSPKYGTLLGYTHEELEVFFDDYIDRASDALGVSRDRVIREMTENYDGFCFEKTGKQKVFTPWSVLSFLNEPQSGYSNYWYKTAGKPSVLMNYLLTHEFKNPQEYGRGHWVSFDELDASYDLPSIKDIVLLNQAGYYTIKAVDVDAVCLAYPNKEVSQSMAKLYADSLLQGQRFADVNNRSIANVLETATPTEVVEVFNRAMLRINYLQKNIVNNEALVQNYLTLLLTAYGLDPVCERMSALGRSDIEVTIGGRHWVFELKFVHKAQEKDKLNEAVNQIRENHYGDQVCVDELIKVALVFS